MCSHARFGHVASHPAINEEQSTFLDVRYCTRQYELYKESCEIDTISHWQGTDEVSLVFESFAPIQVLLVMMTLGVLRDSNCVVVITMRIFPFSGRYACAH
jgi:hypothetical protein